MPPSPFPSPFFSRFIPRIAHGTIKPSPYRPIFTQPFLAPQASLPFDPDSIRPHFTKSSKRFPDPDLTLAPNPRLRPREIEIVGLPRDTKEEDVRSLIYSYGIKTMTVEQRLWVESGRTEKEPTGRFVVQVVHAEDIPRIMTLDCFPADSFRLRTVDTARKLRTPRTRNLSKTSLFIKNLPPQTLHQDIESTFASYGISLPTFSTKLILTEDDEVCACVKLGSEEDQKRALENIEGMSVMRARGDLNTMLKSVIRVKSLADVPPGYGVP